MRTRRRGGPLAPGRARLGALAALLCLFVALAPLRGSDHAAAGSCGNGAPAVTNGAKKPSPGSVVAASPGQRASARLRVSAVPALVPCPGAGSGALSQTVVCFSCPAWIVLAASPAGERAPPA